MKNHIILFTIFLLSVAFASAQTKKEPKVRVLLLGTFHFAQNGADDDMMSEKRQKEIVELANKVYKFKPNKIFIERNPEFEYVNKLDDKYQDYLAGKFTLSANEIYQLGFRLGKMLDHKKIYQADHPNRFVTIYGKVEDYAKKNGQADLLGYEAIAATKPLWAMSSRNQLKKQKTTLEYFRYINGSEYQRSDQASYLSRYPRIGDTKPTNSADDKKDADTYFIGAELISDWYKRNIIIYSKVLTQLDYQEDCILIIYGVGHMPILRHLFESNPAFKVEDTNKWLK